jgi:hypothetical protein
MPMFILKFSQASKLIFAFLFRDLFLKFIKNLFQIMSQKPANAFMEYANHIARKMRIHNIGEMINEASKTWPHLTPEQQQT